MRRSAQVGLAWAVAAIVAWIERERNPGFGWHELSPDFAALNPGYILRLPAVPAYAQLARAVPAPLDAAAALGKDGRFGLRSGRVGRHGLGRHGERTGSAGKAEGG